MKLGPSLLALPFLLMGFGAVRALACQYCEMASDPSLQVTFPTPDAIPAAGTHSSASLTAPVQPSPVPAATFNATVNPGTLAVSIPPAGRRVTRRIPAAWLQTQLPPGAAPPIPPATVNAPTVAQASGSRWADVGLLGMAAAGGVFCWRTRRGPGD